MALSANTPRAYELGDRNTLPVKASSTIYEGSAVGMTAGYARALNAGDLFAGFALAKAVGTGSDGGVTIDVVTKGRIAIAITAAAVTDIGKPVYASDDGTFTFTPGSNSKIGKVVRWVSTGNVIAEFNAVSTEEGREWMVVSLPVQLAAITGNGDVLTTWTPGFAGRIEKVAFAVTTVVTTGLKATDLNLEIGTTNLTGGVVALTSANCTPLGAVIAGSAITANNTFSATDTISVESANTTAFAEGQGVLLITISSEV